ncbi:MAG: regulatory protein RecX [Gemmatimonadales bacterium]
MVPPRTIERLERDRRVADAIKVVVDGAVVLSLPAEAVVAERLAVGTELSEGLLERLTRTGERHAAYQTALRLLGRRGYARRDLGRRLLLKGHQPAAIEAALDRAEQAGLLDEERFARHFVQTRSARGRGPARIRRELLQQGVPDRVVETVLAEELPDGADQDVVVALARKRARQLVSVERPVRLRRVMAYLARRGYTGPEIRRLVRSAI